MTTETQTTTVIDTATDTDTVTDTAAVQTQTTVTREQHRGVACVYFDPRGKAFDALITEVWGPQCVNVVYVNDVDDQRDSYGQKLIRSTSVMHGSIQQAHGNYWLLPGEKRPALPFVVDSAA